MASPGADTDEEGMKRPRRLGGSPRRLNQHRPGMAATDLADTAVMSGPQARLAHPRVQAKVADELARALEPPDIADRGHDAGGDGQVDACDRDQTLDRRVVESLLGDLAIEEDQIFGEPVKFAHMPVDGAAFVVG